QRFGTPVAEQGDTTVGADDGGGVETGTGTEVPMAAGGAQCPVGDDKTRTVHEPVVDGLLDGRVHTGQVTHGRHPRVEGGSQIRKDRVVAEVRGPVDHLRRVGALARHHHVYMDVDEPGQDRASSGIDLLIRATDVGGGRTAQQPKGGARSIARAGSAPSPGSTMCTWTSRNPGRTVPPRASIS